MRWLSLFIPILLLVGCAEAATATPTPAGQVSISTNVTFYQVTGATADDLRAQMDRLRRIDESGNHWDAYTEWDVNWSYPYLVESDACAAGPVEVSVEVTFVFPRWDPAAGASRELIEKWEAYLTALEDHEEGHKEIAIAAGHEVLRAIEALPAYQTCDELEQAADAVAGSVLEHYRQQEALYDRETEHGMTQGVSFP